MIMRPKDLARELGIDFKYCRKIIRRKFKRRLGRTWKFNEKEARVVRKYLIGVLSNGRAK